MPHELIVVSARPVDVGDHLVAAVSVNPDLLVRHIWNGGATQVCSPAGAVLLTVLRSKGFDVPEDVERLTGSTPTTGQAFWTELYSPMDPGADLGFDVARALAQAAEGDLFVREGIE
jgi:hypothetical protein